MATGRYAPTPSGDLHVGNLRTALLAWLLAHSSGSTLRLRIDDLDPGTRNSVHESRQLADLDAIGITFEEPPLRQSERLDAYESALGELESAALTYPCFCSRREIREATVAAHHHLPEGAYPGTCRGLDSGERTRRARTRPAALRVRADGAEVDFVDDLHGPTRGVVDDFVVRRNDGVPAYNLATVVDDADQGIEQVVRGDDLLAGTARQIWLRQRLDLQPVAHAHVPLVVNRDGQRLAKRDGAVTLGELAELGYSADRVRRVLVRSLGPDVDPDLTVDDLARRFDSSQIARTPLVWPPAEIQKNASETE